MQPEPVQLTEQQATLARELVNAGRFRTTSEVIDAGLRLLHEQNAAANDDAEIADSLPVIQKSLEQVRRGEARPARDAIRQIAAEHGIQLRS